MNLKLHPLRINSNDPFESDLLNRKGEIENLTTLIVNMNTPAVLAIDSRWGTGKTTFIKLWENHLKKSELKSLYFNAWETDFSDDPLVSFLGEMNGGLKSLIGSSKESSEHWKKAKAAGKQLARRGLPALIKVGTMGVIDADKIVEAEMSKMMGALAGDALDGYLKQKEAISEFHDSLTSFISKVSENKPIVVFVDELDRCRPTYAISLLERIKHLFNIKGLVFVIALDKCQLGCSISSVYGEGIDVNGYLRRFIDFEYSLKKPNIEMYVKSIFSTLSLDDFFEERKKYNGFMSDGVHLENVFLMLAKLLKLSLRETEQLLASINLALRTAKQDEHVHSALLAFLVVAKNVRFDLYQDYILDTSNEEKLIDYLHEIVPEENRAECFECALVEGFLIAAKNGRYSDKKSAALEKHRDIIGNRELPYQETEYSEAVINVINGIGRSVNLKLLVERIDMISQFKFEVREDEGQQGASTQIVHSFA